MKKNNSIYITFIICVLIALLVSYTYSRETIPVPDEYYELANIPEYSGKKYIYINNNEPKFDEKYRNTKSFESYSTYAN